MTTGQAGDPRVTVVIITRDRSAELARTLDHLASVRERPPVIVVDNGSSDGTADVVARRATPAVQLLRSFNNLGAAGRNLGVLCSHTPYVAFSDDDTLWDDGSLSRAADALDTHPNLAVVCGRVVVGEDRRDDTTSDFMARTRVPIDTDGAGTAILGFLAGASMVRRSAFLAVGGFHRAFNVGGEEELTAIDLAAAGWAMAYVRDVVVQHQPSQQREPPFRRRVTLARNRIWCSWLRRPARVALADSARLARRAVTHRDARAALTEAARGLPWVLRERQVAPPFVQLAIDAVERGPVDVTTPPSAADTVVGRVAASPAGTRIQTTTA